ncbi:MAG: WecB/TagA/CpsF family glycosyltransferase [Verrucomicrobia bacterium]|nr:WecB/TagA/CpsF family glycosyltransferase [Verrucomicrobiota bacterium]
MTEAPTTPRTFNVLGTPLLATDYDALAAQCRALAREPRVTALEFANTHLVTLRRHDPAFAARTAATDFFLPDGMPLIWRMNSLGAGLKDRVYGPAFMRRCFETTPASFTHFLLGGSPECGKRLRAAIGQWNPAAEIRGSFHGNCGLDGIFPGEDDDRLVEELNRLSPDFIWVGLGTPKQQAWIHRNKPRLARGVLCSVGFAFDVHAGLKPDAPLWMQQRGLTWLFRACSEPQRLAGRYLKYNSLFLWYLLRDGLAGRGK